MSRGARVQSSYQELGRAPRVWSRRVFLRATGGVAGMWLLAACGADAAPDAPAVNAATGSEPAGQVAPPAASNAAAPNAAVTIPQNTSPIPTDEEAQQLAQESVDLVNQARNAAGLESLAISPLLTQVAAAYSQRMAAEDFYGHEDPQGEDVGHRLDAAGYLAEMSAENIARGQPDAPTVVEGWLNSPGHRANIMNPELREIGAGYAYTETAPYHHYWTHVFGTPDASVGRDRSQYPAQTLAEINRVRQAAGQPPLQEDATLVQLATTHLQALVAAPDYEAAVQSTLDAVSQAAVQTFAEVVALSAAGSATPEAVVVQWSAGEAQGVLLDTTFTVAGIAYHFDDQADFRHYWLLLLGA